MPPKPRAPSEFGDTAEPVGVTMYVPVKVKDMIRREAKSRGIKMTDCLRQIMADVEARRLRRDRRK